MMTDAAEMNAFMQGVQEMCAKKAGGTSRRRRLPAHAHRRRSTQQAPLLSSTSH